MSSAELKSLIDEALGGVQPDGAPSDRLWDSLDQLEITTHLHDHLGDGVSDIDALASFKDFDELAGILRTEGFIE
ncbi:hypothetical protein L687_00740 [Microbacterium maritypicum MF109]|uniref:Carrier domain-containing protein n=2 Tax=Microbacteriaceae TaxID=85023 RepID=T5KIB2_MICMQ|nr:hypothetical protein L687_00740 [Microbacterium maritypicum MF109]